MNKLLLHLFIALISLSFQQRARAQCAFPVTLHTNKDYCVGSSIIATSKHAMQQITWNGTFHGTPAPAGTYVYIVVMKFAAGNRQVYKGTVILIR
jgi:hypothetical protein